VYFVYFVVSLLPSLRFGIVPRPALLYNFGRDMCTRALALGFAAVLLLGLATGCHKSPPGGEAGANPASGNSETIARVHWLGKERIAVDPGARSLMEVWSVPESAMLEAHILEKLAAAPWHLAGASTNSAPSLTNSLRPICEDLLRNEAYLEIRQPDTNAPAELALAVRLDDAHAAVWQTNLAAVVESLTGTRPTPASSGLGWSLAPQPLSNAQASNPPPRRFELARVGNWTVLSAAPASAPKAQLAAELAARIQKDGAPYAARPTNYWLEANLDLRRVANAFSLACPLPPQWPAISLNVLGDGRQVLTHGQFNFPQPLPFKLEKWNIPTNLVHSPLISFTAVQGLAPWLVASKTWNSLGLGTPPNQFYSWAQQGQLFLSFFAAPIPNASNVVAQATGRLLREANPWMATNAIGTFQQVTNGNGAEWTGFPFMSPFVRSVSLREGNFVLGGGAPSSPFGPPPPAPLMQELSTRPNLVAYDWELTGPRVESLLYVSQVSRFLFRKPQLPARSISVVWLKGVESKLANSTTEFFRTGPDQVSLVRQSSIGLTALELHCLADWLESPQFPCGLHTTLGPPDPVPARKAATGQTVNRAAGGNGTNGVSR
jgi:hypothetical protein